MPCLFCVSEILLQATLLFIDVNNMLPSSCHTKLALYADSMAVITMYLKLLLLAIYEYNS